MTSFKAKDIEYLKIAIDLAKQGMSNNFGGPFGAIIVKDEKVIGKGFNRVTSSNDPTAHAEVVAIRDACNTLHSFQLDGCTIYSSCEPCPMCLGAIYWARLDRLVFSSNRNDAKNIGFDDELIYTEIALPLHLRKIKTIRIPLDEAVQVFKQWASNNNKIEY